MASQEQSSTLIIAGMHRSGTSLTASILQSAGLHIGRKLLGADHVNVKGHYENLDFYAFHKAVLRSQGVDENGWTLQETIEVDNRFVEQAKELIAKNAVSAVWGWKEPRTTLFLEFWANLLPEAKFLLLYRFPWEVVDSLYRRGDPIFKSQPDLAVKIWRHYNQKVLNLYNQFSDRCFLINLHVLLNHLDTVISTINQKFQLNLAIPSSTPYNPSLIHKQSIEGHRASLITHYFPEGVEMYRELEARAWQVNDTPDFSWIDQLKNTPYRNWAFQDWLQLGNWEGEKSKLQHELESSRSQFQQTQGELEKSRSQLQQTQGELEKSRSQLQQTQKELESSRSQHQQTQTELENSRSQLQQTQQELEGSLSQYQQTQTELENSRSQLQQTQKELDTSLSQYQQTQTELEQSQQHQHQTEELLEQSLSQQQQTQDLLEQSTIQLEQIKEELEQTQAELYQVKSSEQKMIKQSKRSQAQLYQVQSELAQAEFLRKQTDKDLQESMCSLKQMRVTLEQSQIKLNSTETSLSIQEEELKATQQLLDESMSELEQLKTKLEQVQVKWYHSDRDSKRSHLLLLQTQAELEQAQIQLYQTQEELVRVRLQEIVVDHSYNNDNESYKFLVWKAWSSYRIGNLNQMAKYLRQASKQRVNSRSEMVLDWLDHFTQLSQENGISFDVESLTTSQEWKQLIRKVITLKAIKSISYF